MATNSTLVPIFPPNFVSTNRQGNYQCGYKWSPRKEMGDLLICKETRK
jgi:hypothetical protein